MDLGQWAAVASQAAFHVPIFIVLIVAAVIAVQRWEQHPTTSALVVTASALLVVEAIANSFFSVWVTANMHAQGWSMARVSQAYAFRGVMSSIIHAGLMGMLILAIFVDRAPAPRPPA